MSVSVLSLSDSGSLLGVSSETGRFPPIGMSRLPNLKRPWEQEYSPTRSSHHPLDALSQQPVPRYYSDSARTAAWTTQDSQPQATQSIHLQHGSHPDSRPGSIPLRDMHKRSRLDGEAPGSLGTLKSIVERKPATASIQETAIGQPQDYTSERAGLSQSDASSRAVAYHVSSQASTTVLPSPASATSSASANKPSIPQSLPPVASALLSPVSPSTTHVQNLQHELSTKTLAYNSLAEEHERLLGAYQRLQTRLAAMDRKSKAADGELTMLQEERISLEERVEGLEKELEEIRAAKEADAKQQSRDSEQWRQIINLSGVVQKQHMEEEGRWKAEKERLARQVADLEEELSRVRLCAAMDPGADGHGSGLQSMGERKGWNAAAAFPTKPANTAADQVLRNEITVLRRENEEAKKRLDEYRVRMGKLKDLFDDAGRLTTET